ncbi:hypothetical protein AB5I41_00310 [Sphingomonas sp. MMS24-JH45]
MRQGTLGRRDRCCRRHPRRGAARHPARLDTPGRPLPLIGPVTLSGSEELAAVSDTRTDAGAILVDATMDKERTPPSHATSSPVGSRCAT